MSRLTGASDPETGTITYGYDANGNQGDLTSRVAPAPNQTGSNSVTTTYNHDALHRLTQKSYSDGTTLTAYYFFDQTAPWGTTLQNPVTRLTTYGTYNGSWITSGEASYDSMGRQVLDEECVPLSCPSLNYTYDLAGDIATYTNGEGVTYTQSIDAAGRPTGLTSSLVDSQHPAALIATDPSAGYYPNGSPRKMTFGNGLTQATEVEARLQPCTINVNSSNSMLNGCGGTQPNGTLVSWGYVYGSWGTTNNGTITYEGASGAQNFGRTYTYDSVNRLSTLSSPSDPNNCTGLSWSYDPWGNRTAQTTTAGSCPQQPSTTFTNNNRFPTSPYAYDAAGNLTADGSHTYYYDAENRLVQVDGTFGTCSTATACYIYDAFGRRVQSAVGSTTTDYVYNLSGNVVTELTNTCGSPCWAVGHTYFNGSLVADYKNSTTYFVHADNLGSTRLVSGIGSDLISNPGFESGESDWTGWSSNITLIDNSSLCHSGSYCAQISWNSSTGGPDVMNQTLAVQPGDQITFGGWVNLQSGGGGALGWWLQTENSSGTAIGWINAGSSPTTSGWQFQTATYTVPSGVAYVALYATVWQPNSSATILVDDGFLYDNRTSLQIVQNLDYLPFGELNSSDSGAATHEFTGLEHDSETNLDHTWFRQYSSNLGRWMHPDPAGLAAVDPTNPQSWNRYAYVRNAPLQLTDRLGLLSGPLLGGLDLGCTEDGFAIPCAMAMADLASGGAVECPNGSCYGFNANGQLVQYAATLFGAGYECTLSGTYSTAQAAGIAATACAAGVTSVTGDEGCGAVYSSGGNFSFGLPTEGTQGDCQGNLAVPNGANGVAIYHSHPDNPNALTEQFSYQGCNGNPNNACDIGTANNMLVPSFLGTPAGRVEVYDPAQSANLPLGCVLVGSPTWGYVQAGILAPIPSCQ